MDKYLLPSCTGRRSRSGLDRGIIGCFPRVLLLPHRSCCVRCDLLWVTDLCNPCGTISTGLHLSSMLALGKTPIQGETQNVQLASNFSPLQSSTLSYVLNFCRKSIIIQLERFFGLLVLQLEVLWASINFFQTAIISFSRTFSTEFCSTMKYKDFLTASWYMHLRCSGILAQCSLVLD